MSKRALAVAGAIALATTGLAIPSADAGSGPPPPVSTNGHPVRLFASGLKTPTSFAFGHGRVFVGDGGNSEGSAPPNGGVYVLRNGKAHKIPSTLKFVGGITWHAHKLYVSGARLAYGRPSWVLMAWSGWNGKTFTHRRTLYTAPSGFGGFNGIGFGADGRLYVGDDVGLTDGNDHGPRSTSPMVYQILTFNADGSDRRVFASGMRQPWQFTFAKDSNWPFVTDLGQDKGAKNPPDMLLHVKAGQDYGFPKCNRTNPQRCHGYARPFRRFSPHTDLMGIALHEKTFYLTSFLGAGGKGPGGEVFSLRRHRTTLRPLIKGFVAPTVGLGYHNGFVYVGELTGQVYRLAV